MYKIPIKLSKWISVSGSLVVDIEKTLEVTFDFYPELNEVVFKIESEVRAMKTDENDMISIEIKKPDGGIWYSGVTENGGLHGVSTS
ncbi:MAG: hypothetical protein IT215_04420 [Chitinophagaceae bacterium]|nr:hypothetical protein [Chitinophagaceae bacterium]